MRLSPSKECHLFPVPATPEEKILQIISEFTPALFQQISQTSPCSPCTNSICACFVALMSTIIYEKSEEEQDQSSDSGLDQLKVYARKPYEAYQHLLILKSCTDLQKYSAGHL